MICYNKLWKRMIDCGLNKTLLRGKAGVSTNAIAKMGKGEKVSMDVLIKICTALDCNIGDIIDVLPPKNTKVVNLCIDHPTRDLHCDAKKEQSVHT